MEAPKALANEELTWIVKEPALVSWKEPNHAERRSLGQPCPRKGPTQLTLWIGEHPGKKSLTVVLQLTVNRRFSKRRKTFDLFLVFSSSSHCPEGASAVRVCDVPEGDIRQCLEEAYGVSSTRRCLRVPFVQCSSRVLMQLQPENAQPIEGTALHLMMLFRSLSGARELDVHTSYSDYTAQLLLGLQARLNNCIDPVFIKVAETYGGTGGAFDAWAQFNAEHFKDFTCVEDDDTRRDPTCPPPPYCASSVQADGISVAPGISSFPTLGPGQLKCSYTAEGIQPLDAAARTPKRLRTPSSSEGDQPHPKILRPFHVAPPYSPTVANTSSTTQISRTPSSRETSLTPRHTGCQSEQVERSVLIPDISDITKSVSVSDHKSSCCGWLESEVFSRIESVVLGKLPQLVDEVLRQTVDAFLENVEDGHARAEFEFSETVDEAKTEIHSVRDEGIASIDEHAQEVLAEFGDDVDASKVAAIESLEETSEEKIAEFRERLCGLLKKTLDGRVNIERTSTQARMRSASVVSDTHPPQKENIENSGGTSAARDRASSNDAQSSPAVSATQLFLRDFGSLSSASKVKVLERLASGRTADIFLTVDDSLRKAWVHEWTGQVL